MLRTTTYSHCSPSCGPYRKPWHSEQWGERLEQLRQIGVQIAIDDFGVGFASVAYLFQFQPNDLKLDLSDWQARGVNLFQGYLFREPIPA